MTTLIQCKCCGNVIEDDSPIDIGGYCANHQDMRANAAEARAAELAAQLRNRCDECGAKIIDNCQNCGAPQCCPQCCKIDELSAQLATAQARITELESQARDNNHRMMTGQPYIVHTRPTEWDQETPLGQMLDSIGDEVES